VNETLDQMIAYQPAKFLDIDVDELARAGAFVAPDRLPFPQSGTHDLMAGYFSCT
jgi:hypothetical protein